MGRVLVKDESSRLGLPAFKVLGASWACHQVLQRQPGAELVTATDGNHGRAVARTAAHLGVPATVFVPDVMLPEHGRADRRRGRRGDPTECGVRRGGASRGGVRRAVAGPRARPGHRVGRLHRGAPAGSSTDTRPCSQEVDDQLGRAPDLVAVPVGVGSLAEAVVRHHRRPARRAPVVLSVEPDTAACVLASLAAGDARPRSTQRPP